MKKTLLSLCLIVASFLSKAQTIQLTNGGSTTLSGSTSANPVSAYFEYMHFQVVYTKAELNAAGITGPKTITQLGWYISTAPSNALPSYKIRMGNTTATTSAAHDATPVTEVYSTASYAPVAGGFDMLTLNGTFAWNGNDNLLVDVCFGPAVYVAPYGEVRSYAASTTTGSRRVRCDACGSQCGSNTTTANTFKPQVSLTFGAAPTCVAPTGLAAVVAPDGTSANFSWAAATGSPTGYEWAATTSATPPASGTATAALNATINGLTTGLQYYLHVRTNCGAGGFSSWATLPFSTLVNDEACGAIALTLGGPQDCGNTAGATSVTDPTLPGACSTPNNTVWYSYTPAVSGPVIIRTEIPAGTSNALAGWVAMYTATGTCPSPGLSFTAVPSSVCMAFGQTGAGDVDSLATVSLTAGTKYYIMIDGTSGDNGEYCIRLLPPPPPPGCVTNVAPANAATGVAILPNTPISWNAEANASSYDVYFGTTNPPTTLIGNVAGPATNVNITGLSYSTTYYWYVAPKNAGGAATGCSTNTTSFTTISAPANCVPITTNGCSLSDRIDLFRLKGEVAELNINTGTLCSPTGYTDTTDHPFVVNLARGKSYWGQLKAGTTGDYLSIWIDANDNGFFENSERVMNNFLMGSSTGNFNLFVPLSTATGNHRMRARLVYYSSAPTTSTSPCDAYSYSDTKDFLVNIIAGGTSYTVANYASAGACYTGGGDIIIDAASNNNGNYVPLVDSSNALIAQLYPQNNDLGRVSTSYFVNNTAVRLSNGIYYLDRNLTITVAKQPTTPYNLRFPYKTAELNALIAQPGSGVTSQFDLSCTRNDNTCLAAVNTASAYTQLIFPTGFGNISGDRFVDMTGINGFSSFYLHGGGTPLPIKIDYFTGTRLGINNLLEWKVSCSNTSNVTLTLERSADQRTFSPVYELSTNQQRCLQPFAYTDTKALNGINYYRIKMTEANGTYTYSNIVALMNKNKGSEIVNIAPNPTRGQFKMNIITATAENMDVVISDMQGRIVSRRTVKLIAGLNTLNMEATTLSSGSYVLYGISSEGKTNRVVFVKQ